MKGTSPKFDGDIGFSWFIIFHMILQSEIGCKPESKGNTHPSLSYSKDWLTTNEGQVDMRIPIFQANSANGSILLQAFGERATRRLPECCMANRGSSREETWG